MMEQKLTDTLIDAVNTLEHWAKHVNHRYAASDLIHTANKLRAFVEGKRHSLACFQCDDISFAYVKATGQPICATHLVEMELERRKKSATGEVEGEQS